jgi:antitoxin ParD1/3/4
MLCCFGDGRGTLIVQNVEKLSITLPPEMAAAVRHAVASGAYASASEVIREALRLWQAYHAAHEHEVEELRRAWREGLESGPATPLDFAEIKAKAQSLRAREQKRARS